MKLTLIVSALLLLLSGDVETNPGPGREKKPDPKKVMEEKVNTHDEKIEGLEKTVSEQKKKIIIWGFWVFSDVGCEYADVWYFLAV